MEDKNPMTTSTDEEKALDKCSETPLTWASSGQSKIIHGYVPFSLFFSMQPTLCKHAKYLKEGKHMSGLCDWSLENLL